MQLQKNKDTWKLLHKLQSSIWNLSASFREMTCEPDTQMYRVTQIKIAILYGI